MRLFDRRSRVSVGTLGLDGLDIDFKIARTLGSKPNTCELTIYNLGPTSRALITNSQSALVKVEAGYADGMTLLFSGALREAHHNYSGTDWQTKISAHDGGPELRSSRVLRSFSAGSSVESVVRALTESLGLGMGNATEALRGAALDGVGTAFPLGTVLSGNSTRELNRLTQSLGLEWSVQDGSLQLLARGRSLSRVAVLLSSDTGLIDTPTVSKGAKGKGHKLTAKALLIPDLVPGRRVQLKSLTAVGTYRIASATYTGQTAGSDWYAEIVCEVER